MKDLLNTLGFIHKENTKDILIKYYSNHDNYSIEINLEKKIINFGNKIFFNDSKNSIQNITKPEDLVVLECVDRLLQKGYKPQNIILEKVYPTGHGTSGRLDAHILKFNNICTHKLVELYLNRMDLSAYITGQAQPKLNQKNLNQIQIPLPSLQEQQQIVKQIEEIEYRIQTIENELKTLPIKKEEILKKYL